VIHNLNLLKNLTELRTFLQSLFMMVAEFLIGCEIISDFIRSILVDRDCLKESLSERLNTVEQDIKNLKLKQA
jgi:hypothetical protein